MVFKKLENEKEEQFIWRLCQAKDSGVLDMDWNEIADVINKEYREDESEYRTEAAYRKPYQQAKRFYESGVFSKYDQNSYAAELIHEIRKEKQKLFDERTALNKVLREQGRMESMFDIVKRAIDEYQPINFNYTHYEHNERQYGENDLIIHLTDIHCGMDINTPFNTFNFDVLNRRLKKFLNEIIDIRDTFHSQNAYLIIGGDLVHGIIHLNARIEAKENLITQIMKVADSISNFIFELSKLFQNVEVHTTTGNHSRSTPGKEDSPRGENFDLLIPYICKKELKDVNNVQIIDNYLGCDIAAFTVRGHMVYAAHGDKDTPRNVVYNMTKFARKAGLPLPEICYLGHRHTNGLTTVDDVKVIESGCVGGMDSYAIDQRLVGTPEQTITVVTEQNCIKALCDVQIE